MEGKIKTLFIFEILGKPPEHIKETLKNFVDKLGEEKGINILKTNIKEPKSLEEKPELFTTFAEVELEADNLQLILLIASNMLPSHIEIIEPENFKITNSELSDLLGNMTSKLHKFDEVTKAMALREEQYKTKIKELEEKLKDN